jgi:hypothetical protein
MQCRFDAQADPEAVQKMLVSAVMVAWPTKSPHPEVQLRGSIGEAGEIEAETQVCLVRCVSLFLISAAVLRCTVPVEISWAVSLVLSLAAVWCCIVHVHIRWDEGMEKGQYSESGIYLLTLSSISGFTARRCLTPAICVFLLGLVPTLCSLVHFMSPVLSEV